MPSILFDYDPEEDRDEDDHYDEFGDISDEELDGFFDDDEDDFEWDDEDYDLDDEDDDEEDEDYYPWEL